MTPTVLIVDDEPQNIELAQIVLQKEGYELLYAKDGHEALELLRSRSVNVLVLDLMMPGLSGFEVLEQLKHDDNLKSLPVLVVTALGQEENRNRAMRLGADAYLVKPYDIIDLKMRVKAMFKITQGAGDSPTSIVTNWFETIDEWMDANAKRHILALMLEHLDTTDASLLDAVYHFIYACGTGDWSRVDNKAVVEVIQTRNYAKTPMDGDRFSYILRCFNVALVRYRASIQGVDVTMLLKGSPDRYFLSRECC